MLYNIILSHCHQNMKSIWVAICASSVTDMGQTCLLGHLLKVSKAVIYRASKSSGERCSQPEHLKRKVIRQYDRLRIYSQSFCLWVDAKKSHQSWSQHWMCWTVFLFSFLVLFLSYKSACQSCLWELLSWNVICGYSSLVFVYAQVE